MACLSWRDYRNRNPIIFITRSPVAIPTECEDQRALISLMTQLIAKIENRRTTMWHTF